MDRPPDRDALKHLKRKNLDLNYGGRRKQNSSKKIEMETIRQENKRLYGKREKKNITDLECNVHLWLHHYASVRKTYSLWYTLEDTPPRLNL